jgi:uncharacterized integral membrane protein (TIGR00697 family)
LIIAKLIVAYDVAPCDDAQPHLAYILANTTRIVAASFASYLTTQFIDIYVYGILKRLTQEKYFVMRNYASLCLSQLLDTILFSYLGLYGIVENIGHIILVSYAIKVGAIVMMSPFLVVAKKCIRKEIK